MIDGLTVQAIITARGGSKGLPGKNLLPLAGRPLIAWTVAAALACPLVDDLILSTDDVEIAAAAIAAGCRVPFRRPPELAGDDATSMEVLRHALAGQRPPPGIVVLLQPTSPLRQAADITATLELLRGGAPAAIAVTPAKKPPQWMYRLDPGGGLSPLLDRTAAAGRRQDLPPAYLVNGAVYAARTDWLLANGGFIGPGTLAHVMPPERSVDIDDRIDFLLTELLMREGVPGSGNAC